MKFILAIALFSLLSCKKDNLALRVIAPGTKCTIKSGVFTTNDKQPAQPVIVDSELNQPNNALIFYNVTDTQGMVWQIPDDDLVIVK